MIIRSIYLLIAPIAVSVANAKEPLAFEPSVHQFLQTSCISCHGEEKQKGDRAFHQLANKVDGRLLIDLNDESSRYLLEDILDLGFWDPVNFIDLYPVKL